MPTINLYELYKRTVRKFGISDYDTYRESFVDAVNLAYSELNEKVFEAATLEPIASFDDIIDTRLAAFNTITHVDSDSAIQNREFWVAEYEVERTSFTNTLTDTITVGATTIVLSIANSVFSIVGDSVSATATLPEADSYEIAFESSKDGNTLMVNGDLVALTYASGDEESTVSLGEVDSHVLSAVSGFEVLKMRFRSPETLIYQFDMNDDSATLVDDVASYTATVDLGTWDTRYVEPSTPLDARYRSALSMGLDFHLQDGGQWGLEPEVERERKWYSRGISSAREVYSQITPYISPLNI